MPWRGKDLPARRHFHDLAEIHDRNAMGHVLDDREIVADEQQREAELALQILQQIDDLRLDRNVERGNRLVAHDQLGFGRERARNADALTLAAGEFVGPAVQRLARQAHGVHQRCDANLEILRGFGEAEIADRLGQDVAHAHARVEARERILEHHLHAAAHLAHRARRSVVDTLAVEDDLARSNLEQPQNGAADRRLAAAGLADQRQRLAARDLERHAVHRIDELGLSPEQALVDRKMLLEVVDLEQRRTHAATAPLAA